MIGEQLKKVRAHLKMNQTEFAETLGIKQMTYSHYELNSREMPFAKVYLLAEKHKVNLNWLFFGEGPMFVTFSVAPITEDQSILEIIDYLQGNYPNNLKVKEYFLEYVKGMKRAARAANLLGHLKPKDNDFDIAVREGQEDF